MNGPTSRRLHGESGAALLLAIAFLVVIAGISGAVMSSVTSGLNNRTALDQVRNRQYAADGAIEAAIADVRARMTSGQAQTPCATALPTHTLEDPAITIQVDCTFVPQPTRSGYFQRNVIFAAHCASAQPPQCPNTTGTIIRAQVNFASDAVLDAPSIAVSRTYVQSWSVNA